MIPQSDILTDAALIEFIRKLYATDQFIPLHEPSFADKEREYVLDCVDSTFVSTVGAYVDRFEQEFASFTGRRRAVAVVNGTQALYMCLLGVGVERGEEVITQSLTFVATANAIAYTGARGIFLDVDADTMGLSPQALREFLKQHTRQADGRCYNQKSGALIRAVVPMHTFGHACRIREIAEICAEYNLELIEDAAESLGTRAYGQHSGAFGRCAAFSFNGNKVMTTGGGGMIATDDDALADRLKHLTTTARVAEGYEFAHDEIGFNYRMPNLNAALGVAQLERLPELLQAQQDLAGIYRTALPASGDAARGFRFVDAPEHSESNFWLNAIRFNNRADRDAFLKTSNEAGVMTRPIWKPMHVLPMFADWERGELPNTAALYDTVVNISSSVNFAG